MNFIFYYKSCNNYNSMKTKVAVAARILVHSYCSYFCILTILMSNYIVTFWLQNAFAQKVKVD